MPRTEIELPYRLEYLSILNEAGEVDQELEPDLSEDLLLYLHRSMLLGRRFDERMLRLQRQGRIGTFPPIKGQEAAHVGTVAALRESDWFVPAFRETAAEIMRGRTIEEILLYFAGYDEGGHIPPDAHNLPIAVPVASQIPHATGLGYAIQYQQRDEVVMAFFGDGATSEGDFHEGLNMAAVYQVPVVFVCQNNQWAISIPRSLQTRSKTIAQKAIAYGMPGLQVDGNDVLATYVAAQEALERARAGDGPTLIECVTYRLSLHTTADDPTRYRSDEEVEEWAARDPIPRFQQYLIEKGVLTAARIEELEAEIKEEIQTAVQRFEEQTAELGDPLDMFKYHYAESPPYLQEQREELRRELESREGGD